MRASAFVFHSRAYREFVLESCQLAASASPPYILSENVISLFCVKRTDVRIRYYIIVSVRAPQRELTWVDELVKILALCFETTYVSIGLK